MANEINPCSGFIDSAGASRGFTSIDNKPAVSATNELADIARGKVTGKTVWSKIGATPTMTTSVSEYWDKAGSYAFMTAAAGLEVVSSDNTQDKANGTGALTVGIDYLDNTFAEKTTTVTLNGTTAVPTTPTDIFRINSFYVATAGTNGAPVGNISLRTLTTGTVTYAYILAGQNFARQAIYTVPLGKKLYITDFWVGYGQSTAAQHYTSAYIMANIFKGAKTTLFYPHGRVFTKDGLSFVYSEPHEFIAGVDIKVSGLSSQAGIGEVRLSGWLE